MLTMLACSWQCRDDMQHLLLTAGDYAMLAGISFSIQLQYTLKSHFPQLLSPLKSQWFLFLKFSEEVLIINLNLSFEIQFKC